MKKIIEKQLVVEIPEDLHLEIKKQALFNHVTIRYYVTQAILEQLKKDAKYQ